MTSTYDLNPTIPTTPVRHLARELRRAAGQLESGLHVRAGSVRSDPGLRTGVDPEPASP